MITRHKINKYQTKGALLQKYYHLNKFSIAQVLREKNDWINVLSKLATIEKVGQHQTLVHKTLITSNLDHNNVLVITHGWHLSFSFHLTTYFLESHKRLERYNNKTHIIQCSTKSSLDEDLFSPTTISMMKTNTF